MGQRKKRMSPKTGNANASCPLTREAYWARQRAWGSLCSCPAKLQPTWADSPQGSKHTGAEAQDKREKMRVLRERCHRTKSGSCWVWPGRWVTELSAITALGGPCGETAVGGRLQWPVELLSHTGLPTQTSGWVSKYVPGLLSHFGSDVHTCSLTHLKNDGIGLGPNVWEVCMWLHCKAGL